MTLTPGNLVLANPMVCTNTAKGDNKLYSDAKGVVPSLDLRFASQKNLNDYMTGTPLVDHQRSMSGSNLSPGTFVNSSGLIETAKVNLVTYSDYSVVESTTDAQLEGLATAPDGTLSARRYSVPSTGLDTINKLATVIDGGTYTFSVWIRSTGSTSQVRTITGNPQFINLVDITTDWQRFSFTKVNNSGTLFGRAYVQMLNVGDEIEVWGAQVEEGTTASTYIPTTNVPSAAPRFDHNPTTGESLGLLVEESRTNYITDQEPTITGSDVTVTYNAPVTAPDGTNTAIRLQLSSGAANLPTATVPSGTTLIVSYYIYSATAITGLTNRLTYGTAVNNFFDLPAGQWIRVTTAAVTDPGTNTTATFRPITSAQTASDDVDVYIWGFQLEAGSFPTSYIPTSGTALTRSADVASITGSNFSSWYNQSEGTVYVSGTTAADLSKGALYLISDGTTNNQWSGSFDPSTGYSGSWLLTGNVLQGDLFSLESVSGNQTFKFAASAATNDFKYFTNGAQRDSDLTVTLPTVNRMGIGSDRLNPTGTIRISRLTYFPERLADATLQDITA